MINRLLIIVFISSIGLYNSYAQEPFACTGDFYLSQSQGITEGFSNIFVVQVDSITQEINFSALPTTNEHLLNALAYRRVDNLIYALDPDEFDLYRIGKDGKTHFLKHLDELTPEAGYFAADINPSGDFMVLLGGLGDVDYELVIINLSNPSYPIEKIPLQLKSTGGTPNTRIVDIAFSPITRELYGVDLNQGRLVTIQLSTGIIEDDKYELSVEQPRIAALFFDVFGNLYGYGSTGSIGQFAMYRINNESGQITFATFGPSTGGVDGCSCPFNVSIQKDVFPKKTLPCSDVLYTFYIANGSQELQTGIVLEDQLPDEFIIQEIVSNPYESFVTSGVGTNHLRIEGMKINSGKDSVVIKVNVGRSSPGKYGNLATISNLPVSLGSIKTSDNPSTLTFGTGDSTYLIIEPYPINALEEVDGFCLGDTLILEATIPNATYLWQDGSSDSVFLVTSGGFYSVTATNDCDTFMASTVIDDKNISVYLPQNPITIDLGDSHILNPEVQNNGSLTAFHWLDPMDNSISCRECEMPTVRPIEDRVYDIVVSNEYGCSSSATVTIHVKINRDIYFPNSFSPNNDGLNDYFFVQSKGLLNVKNLLIFDRWGTVLFEQSNTDSNISTSGWDGKINGENLAPGVYVWSASIEFLDGVIQHHAGAITLLR